MLKLLGLLLTAAGAAGVGFSAADGLSRRVRTLRDLLGALELMEREIAFQLTPMDELFARLAQRTPEPAGAFFARCRRDCPAWESDLCPRYGGRRLRRSPWGWTPRRWIPWPGWVICWAAMTEKDKKRLWNRPGSSCVRICGGRKRTRHSGGTCTGCWD